MKKQTNPALEILELVKLIVQRADNHGKMIDLLNKNINLTDGTTDILKNMIELLEKRITLLENLILNIHENNH